MDAFALFLIGILFLAQVALGKTRFAFRRVGFFGFLLFAIAIIAIFGFAKYQAWQQYLVWKDNDFSRLFLPPYRDWSYFVFYVRARFFNPYIFSLATGILAMEISRRFNQIFRNRFFEPLEPYLIGVGTFAVGYPLCLFYIPIVLITGTVISSLFSFFRMPSNWRLSFLYLWLPFALLTILISRWLVVFPWWGSLRF
jgi:hypothetical protein